MSDQKQNFIGGTWVSGEVTAKINPSNTADIVGNYARADAVQTQSIELRAA